MGGAQCPRMILPLVMHRPVNPYLVTGLGFASSEAYHNALNRGRVLIGQNTTLVPSPGYGVGTGLGYVGWIPDDIHFRMTSTRQILMGGGSFVGTQTAEVIVDDVFMPHPDDAVIFPAGWNQCADSPQIWHAFGTLTITADDGTHSETRAVFKAIPSAKPTIDVSGGQAAWGAGALFNEIVWNGSQWQPVWRRPNTTGVEPTISSRPPIRIL